MGWWRKWFGGRHECMVCRRAVAPGEWTCGEEACELAAQAGQAMLAALVAGQEVGAARRVRFRASLPPADIELA